MGKVLPARLRQAHDRELRPAHSVLGFEGTKRLHNHV
jgi:hypothetical protein